VQAAAGWQRQQQRPPQLQHGNEQPEWSRSAEDERL